MVGAGWTDGRVAMRSDSRTGGRGRRSRSNGRFRRRPARRCRWSFGALVALGLLVAGAAASAQEPEAPTRLVVEEIRSGFVVAPDLKLTSVDGGAGVLTGLYGGFITDRRLLIGAGAYWLTGDPGSVDMAYGGGLVEWFANPGGRVDFSVRTLLGAGRATLVPEVGTPVFYGGFHGPSGRLFPGGRSHGRGRGHHPWRGGNPAWDRSPWPGSVAFRYREDFLVADPQLSVHLNVTDWLRIGGGAGYRFIGHAGPAGERLQGLTASIGLQLGPP